MPRAWCARPNPIRHFTNPSGKTESVHCAHLIGYCDYISGKDLPKEILDLAERNSSPYEVIERIVDVGEDSDGLLFHVQWEGLPDKRDWTWKPVVELFVEIAEMPKVFLSERKSKKNVLSKLKRKTSVN